MSRRNNIVIPLYSYKSVDPVIFWIRALCVLTFILLALSSFGPFYVESANGWFRQGSAAYILAEILSPASLEKPQGEQINYKKLRQTFEVFTDKQLLDKAKVLQDKVVDDTTVVPELQIIKEIQQERNNSITQRYNNIIQNLALVFTLASILVVITLAASRVISGLSTDIGTAIAYILIGAAGVKLFETVLRRVNSSA